MASDCTGRGATRSLLGSWTFAGVWGRAPVSRLLSVHLSSCVAQDVVVVLTLEDMTDPRNALHVPLTVEPALLLPACCPMYLSKYLGRHNPVFTAQF